MTRNLARCALSSVNPDSIRHSSAPHSIASGSYVVLKGGRVYAMYLGSSVKVCTLINQGESMSIIHACLLVNSALCHKLLLINLESFRSMLSGDAC